jgi:hypothetical protein
VNSLTRTFDRRSVWLTGILLASFLAGCGSGNNNGGGGGGGGGGSPTINTVTGNGTFGYTGDGGPATGAEINSPYGISVDSSHNLYIADTGNNVIRKVDSSGKITTVAGSGNAGYGGDGGPATSANLWAPYRAVADHAGNLYIADFYNNRIRKVDTSGTITTFAGTGVQGYNGDGIPAATAQLSSPAAVGVDSAGNVYVVDTSNNRIRKVDNSGVITTIAGTGFAGVLGDGGPATAAQINEPVGIALDGKGNIYIADYGNSKIRKIDASGIITTFAGTGQIDYSGDGGPATSAALNLPTGVAADGSGNVFIADYQNNRIRKVNTAGNISTFAGNGTSGYSGDGGSPTSAEISFPEDVALDSAGNVFIADYNNARIREVH